MELLLIINTKGVRFLESKKNFKQVRFNYIIFFFLLSLKKNIKRIQELNFLEKKE